jgi:hypothetical protein
LDVVTQIGAIARNLLTWARAENLHYFAAVWLIPMVARSTSNAPAETKAILEPILDLVNEENFEIQYISRLCYEAHHLWSHLPEFVTRLFVVVFSHIELSEAQTQMGGGSILKLVSTRRQDFEHCRYSLGKQFPDFLNANPLEAAKACVLVLNATIYNSYQDDSLNLEKPLQQFQFMDGLASYEPDGRYFGDSTHSLNDTEIQMANELFAYLGKLFDLQGNILEDMSRILQYDSLLKVFRDHAKAAYFWKRLLLLGSQIPATLGCSLRELASARVIQTGSDTMYEVGVFIAKVAPELRVEERLKLENNLMSITTDNLDPEDVEWYERIRNRLIGQFPRDLLQTQAAIELVKHLGESDQQTDNLPLVTFTEFEGPTPEEIEAQKQRDLQHLGNVELKRLAAPLERFDSEFLNKIPTSEDLANILPKARELEEALRLVKNADEETQQTKSTVLVEAVSIMARGLKSVEEEAYTFCRSILLTASKDEQPLYDPRYHERYDFASWSSTPRNCAALGLPWLGRFGVDSEIKEAIESLVHDKVPSVRFCIVSEMWRLYPTDSEFVVGLCSYLALNEINGVVQDGLCSIIDHIRWKEPTSKDLIRQLAIRDFEFQNFSDLRKPIASLTTWLAIVREDSWAIAFLQEAVVDPVRTAKLLLQIAQKTLDLVKPVNVVQGETKAVLDRSIDFVFQLITAAIQGLEQLMVQPYETMPENSQESLKSLYRVLDTIILRLRFAFDPDNQVNQTNEDFETNRKDFYQKIKPILEHLLASVEQTNFGMMSASTVHYFVELLHKVIDLDPTGPLNLMVRVVKTGKQDNYQFDEIAMKEVVEFVERLFADFRMEIRDGDPLNDVLDLLDIFAKVGWPDAIGMVWQLDQIFR